MALVCDICWLFACMNAQVVLEHCSGCKAKCDKEHIEQEGQEKVAQKEIQILRMK